MSSTATLRILIAMACLGAGLASANGTEPGPAEPVVLPPPAESAPVSRPRGVPVVPPSMSPTPLVMMPIPPLPAVAHMSPVWLQMPMPGTQPYYVVPQAGGMVWSAAPVYPTPPMPPVKMLAPPGWVPYVLVLVPLQPPAPPAVDYGPVAETPVVTLPPPETSPSPAEPETGAPVMVEPAAVAPAAQPAPSDPVPVAEQPVPPATATSLPDAVPPAPAAESPTPPAPAVEPPPPAGVSTNPTVATVEPEPLPGLPEIDYGPVAPTPVVSLLAAAPQSLSPSVVKPTVKQTAKPVVKKPAVRAGVAQPVKKRMCWSNGVVSPCK